MLVKPAAHVIRECSSTRWVNKQHRREQKAMKEVNDSQVKFQLS